MKTKNLKKYPLMICLIVSCVIVVASLFILGFFGIKIGTSLSGGSQFYISIDSNIDTKASVSEIKTIVKNNGYEVDSALIEDKYKATDTNAELTKKSIVIKISSKSLSDETKLNIRTQVAEKLGLELDDISEIYEMTSSVTSKNILYIGLAVGIIAICLFVFAWIRYGIFASLSILLSYLHNIILYLAIVILTRVELSLVSLCAGILLTLVMGVVLINIYENYRTRAKLYLDDKLTITKRMIESEKKALTPYLFVFMGIFVLSLLMFFIPVTSVRFTALNIIIAILTTLYTILIIGPGSYSALLEVSNASKQAVLSRNDTVNKVIKKKIKKNNEKKAIENDSAVDKTESKKKKSKK